MRKTLITVLIASVVLSLASPAAFASKPAQDCKSSPLDIDFVKGLSIEFGNISLSFCDVTRHREKNFGYGEMAIAQGLSSISGRSLSHIVHMRTEHKMGWGKIAKELGVKVSDAVHRSSSVLDRVGLSGEAARIRIDIDLSDDDKGKDRDKEDHSDQGKDQPPHKTQGNNGKPGSTGTHPGRGNK